MAMPRVKVEGRSIYHTFQRCVDEGAWMDSDDKKEKFCQIMRDVEQYSGCRVLTYVIMKNHYHILFEQTDYEYIDNQELMRRLRCLYGDNYVYDLQLAYEDDKKLCGVEYADNILRRLKLKHLKRMYNVSEFQKTLKQKYAQWYNAKYHRSGSYWGNRFKSVIVQDSPNALFMMATYIELNPVRAGYVEDIKDYKFSNYGDACRGNQIAMANVIRTVSLYTDQELYVDPLTLKKVALYSAWSKYSAWYRMHIFERGQEVTDYEGNVIKLGFSKRHIEDVLEQRGRLSLSDSMHCRVRYMTDGLVFGDKDFCESIFIKFRDHFSEKRESGSRTMTKVDFGGCCTVRALQVDAIQPPK
jgi:REP element-mobilizing transposase RayT